MTEPNTTAAGTTKRTPAADAVEPPDREMCFKQGKVCVYLSADDENVIICEWPNGVVEHCNLRTDRVTRTWPDGKQDVFASGSAEDRRYPHVEKDDRQKPTGRIAESAENRRNGGHGRWTGS